MKIHVPSIPDEGKKFQFNQDQEWVQKLAAERFRDFYRPEGSLSGDIQLFRTNANVTLQGNLSTELRPVCDRCAKTFAMPLEVPLHRHLTPYFEIPDEQREGGLEVELAEEDLDFSCYHNEEIDLGEIIAEEVFLALPMRFICEEKCKGLCTKCGTNINESPCQCKESQDESPFSVLKDLNLPSAPK